VAVGSRPQRQIQPKGFLVDDENFDGRTPLGGASPREGSTMELQRRGLLVGLLAAPFVIRTPGLLMPVSARALVPKVVFLNAEDYWRLVNESTKVFIRSVREPALKGSLAVFDDCIFCADKNAPPHKDLQRLIDRLRGPYHLSGATRAWNSGSASIAAA
jgi:hypothetical protein